MCRVLSILLILAAILAAILAVTACSSVPEFRPSKRVEEASSLNEALEICTEYKIKGDQNASGRPLPTRVPTLVPWIRCYEDIFRKYPSASGREAFVHFFRALQARHDVTEPPDAEVVDWPKMNYAVRKSIDHIKNETLPYAPATLDAIEHELPQFGLFLAESGRIMKQYTPDQARQARLREVREDLGVEGLDRDETKRLPPRPSALNQSQKDYCRKYRNFRGLVFNAEQLGDYKRILDDRATGSDNKSEANIREKVGTRYAGLKKEVLQERVELDVLLKDLRRDAGWFRNGYCL